MTRIATQLIDNRRKQGLTQLELSEALGYTGAQIISNIERGKQSISAKKLNQLAEVLDVDIKLLVNAKIADYKDRLMSVVDA